MLKANQTVRLEAITDKIYRVRGQGTRDGISGWVAPWAFSSTDPDFVANLKNLYTRQGVNIPAIWFMMYNTKAGVFANKDARHALAFAIDRQRIVKQVMQGIARPGAGAFGDMGCRLIGAPSWALELGVQAFASLDERKRAVAHRAEARVRGAQDPGPRRSGPV